MKGIGDNSQESHVANSVGVSFLFSFCCKVLNYWNEINTKTWGILINRGLKIQTWILCL